MWKMSTSYIIVSSWPYFCQKLSKLVKIWQSYDKNIFDCFLDTVLSDCVEVVNDTVTMTTTISNSNRSNNRCNEIEAQHRRRQQTTRCLRQVCLIAARTGIALDPRTVWTFHILHRWYRGCCGNIHCVQKKNIHSRFLLYLHGKCLDFHKIFSDCLGGN